MIVVDTSVWIAYFRGADRALVAHLDELLDADLIELTAPGRLELLAGASRAEAALLGNLFAVLPTHLPTGSTWARAEEWILQSAGKGQRFGAVDLIIAVLATEHSAVLWSLDGDFARMEKLGFIRLHRAT